MVAFSPRIHEAIDFAARAHDGQFRKDPDRHTPYAAHVFAVGYLLAQFDFDEDVVIAGLLHDVLEDRPDFAGEMQRFGPTVMELVRAVSERKLDREGNERSWTDRKGEYVEHIRSAPAGAKAISCADKIHNMESILLALERGSAAWHELKATPEEQVKRMQRVRAALAEGWSHPMLERFDTLLAELERAVAGRGAPGGA